METEVKTIQEMADELGITYDSLRKQLQREPLRRSEDGGIAHGERWSD